MNSHDKLDYATFSSCCTHVYSYGIREIIANISHAKLCTQYIEGFIVTLKSKLRVIRGHWKQNH